MITNITLENFKCFRKVEINLRLISVFIGPNGTGKSSVLQAMALLKQSVGSNGIRHRGEFLSLPNPDEFVPKFSPPPIRVRIVFAGTANQSSLNIHGFGSTVSFRYGAEFPSSGAITSSFGEIKAEFKNKAFEIKVPENTQNLTFNVDDGPGSVQLEVQKQIAVLGRIISTTGPVSDDMHKGLPEVIATPNYVLGQLRLVPAVRGLVRDRYSLGDQMVEDVSLAGGLSGQEDQTATNLGYSRSLEGILSELLKRVTGAGLRAETVPARSIEVKSLIPSGNVNIVAEGFGTNALILLFHQLVRAAEGATVMIEEPEIHLHPKAQAELASVLVEEAKAQSKQLIMTTHSEHILGRLLTLVAEQKLSKDELAIYAFEKDGDGVCTASEIEVTDDGRVKGGLKDFFETDLAELDRYVKALQPKE